MKNNLKRYIISILEHKKDSILLFVIVFVLSIFFIIYFVSYKVSDKMSNVIKENVIIDFTIKDGFIDIEDFDYLEAYLNENKLQYSYYKDNLKKLMTIINNLDSTRDANVHLKAKIDNHNLISINQDLFFKDDYYISEGRFFDDYELNEETYKVICNEDLYYEINDEYKKYELGQFVKIADKEYEIIGFFKKDQEYQMLKDNNHYDDADFIVTSTTLLNIATIDSHLFCPVISFSVVGVDNCVKTKDELENSLNQLKIYDGIEQYSVVEDDSMLSKLEKPIDDLKAFLQVISIFMVTIMFILLSSFLLCIIYSRKHELGIYMMLGQSKIKTAFNFLNEIMIISLLAFLLSIPIAYKTSDFLSNSMIEANLQRQRRIAVISDSEEEIDIFNASKQAYQDYDLNISVSDYLLTFLVETLLLSISCLSITMTSNLKK